MGSGPGLLLAHGAGGGVQANFGPILDRLIPFHTVVGVDYPGSGESPRSETRLTLDALADELVAAADAAGLRRFALAGYSLGGPVAIRAATRYPDRVSALTLSATFPRADARLRLAAEIWSRLYASGDRTLLAEFLTLVALSTEALEAAGDEELRQGIAALAAEIAAGTPEQTDLVARADVSEDAVHLSIPTLVIVTARDPLVSPQLQRELASSIPGARLAELDSGHLPMVEQPDRWATLITSFLAEHPDASGIAGEPNEVHS